MKLLNLVTVSLLSTIILISSTTVVADESRNVNTKGQVTFSPNNEEETIVIPPETDPEVEIENPGVTGPLTITKVATMNFGSQVISNKDQTYKMIAEKEKLANPSVDGPKEVPYVSFAQVQDTRGTNAGWDLKVSLSDFTSSSQNGILRGAQVSLLNPHVQYEGNTTTNAPSVHANRLELIPGAGVVSVMTANPQKGAGVSSVVWGDQIDLNTQFHNEDIDVVKNNDIQLFVPGSTAKDAVTYNATLSWELNSTPTNTQIP